MKKKGLLIVLSGPSGVGKGTIREAIFSKEKREFKSRQQFEDMIKHGDLLEYTEYVGNYYGTPLSYVRQTLNRGKDIFLEIDVRGAMQVKAKMPEGVFIFLTPPNMGELESRIVHRGTDPSTVIKKRMQKAVEELGLIRYYDYAVENDKVENAVNKVLAIIQSEHLKVSRLLDPVYRVEGEHKP